MAAGLLDKKETEDSGAVIGPSMQEPEPFHPEVKAFVLFSSKRSFISLTRLTKPSLSNIMYIYFALLM